MVDLADYAGLFFMVGNCVPQNMADQLPLAWNTKMIYEGVDFNLIPTDRAKSVSYFVKKIH